MGAFYAVSFGLRCTPGWRLGALFWGAFFWCVPVAAGAPPMTMEAAVSRALAQNPEVQAARFAREQAVWDRRRAWSLLFPSLSLSSRYTRIDDRTLAERDFTRYLPPELGVPRTVFQNAYQTSLDVSAPLFNGVLMNGLSIARVSERMVGQAASATRARVVFDVVQSYLGVLKARAVAVVQAQHLERSRLNFEKAERLYAAGRYSRVETLRWKVAFQQQKSAVVESESAVRSAAADLARLLHADPTRPPEVAGEVSPLLRAETEDLANRSEPELVALVRVDDDALLRANPDLASARSGKTLSRLLYRNTYVAYMPEVSLEYTHAWRENHTLALDQYASRTLMVQLRLPLFTSFQNFTASRSAYSAYRESEARLDDRVQRVRYALTEAVNRVLNLRARRELARVNVEFNEHTYRIVEQQREKGLVSNLDWIDAQVNMQNASLEEATTRYDLMAAVAELYYLLGRLEAVVPQEDPE